MSLARTIGNPSLLQPFTGNVWTREGIGFPETTGMYRRLGEGLNLRVNGRIQVAKSPLSNFFDPFSYYRIARINGRTVDFYGTTRPVSGLKGDELARALRTPVYDALMGCGESQLAEIVLAAAVAIGGWPDRFHLLEK